MSNRHEFHLLEELRAIAQLGLNYSTDHYDLERYARLLELASRRYAEISGFSSEHVKSLFQAELGYITPKVGVSASVFDDQGKLLLVQRTDDSNWCLPCGWTEVCESPQQSLQREDIEETGL